MNEDYNVYIERKKLVDRVVKPWRVKRDEGYKNRTWTEDDEREYTHAINSIPENFINN